MTKIIIIGAGAMGSAFSIPCIENNNNVTLIGTHLEDDLIEKNLEVNDKKILLNGLKLVGDFLDKTILKPNNLSYPNSRLLFINSLK